MNRPSRLFALVAIAIAIAACSQAAGGIGDAPTAPPTSVPPPIVQVSPEPTPSPTSSPIATPAPTAQADDPATVLAASGIGPYEVGASLSELQSDGLVTIVNPSFHCDGWQSAEATGRYAEQLTLMFHLGRLTDFFTFSAEFVTPSGARVGMPLTELQSIYGSQVKPIAGAIGNQAFSVHVPDSDLGIVFHLDDATTTIRGFRAGEVERLEIAAVAGEGC